MARRPPLPPSKPPKAGARRRAKKPRRVADSLTISVLKSTLESTADGILVVDLGGRVVAQNRRFQEMWHIPADLVEAADDDRLLAFLQDQLTSPAPFLDKVRELYANPDTESNDILYLKDERVFERFSIPQRLDGRAGGRVWSFRDVTARRRAECVQEGVCRISPPADTDRSSPQST